MMKVYAVQEIYGDNVFRDRTFSTKELADEYCEWKNKHQGSPRCRWSYEEIEVVTRRLRESEMRKEFMW